MANHLISIDTVGREIKARIEAGDKALDKAEQHYIAAGIQLAAAKQRLSETREMRWSAFLFSCCKGMSDDTARNYIALANGDTTLEDLREKAKIKMRESRARAKEKKATTQAQIATKQNSDNVIGKIIQQNQHTSSRQERTARIVAALSAADDDTFSKIEALLNITEENVNG